MTKILTLVSFVAVFLNLIRISQNAKEDPNFKSQRFSVADLEPVFMDIKRGKGWKGVPIYFQS